jgi:CheY-like chemotaxis protein
MTAFSKVTRHLQKIIHRIISWSHIVKYGHAIGIVLKKGNYSLVSKVLPYAFISLIAYSLFMIAVDYYSHESSLVFFRLGAIALMAVFLLYFRLKKTLTPVSVVCYEIILAFCIPTILTLALMNNCSILYLYSAVIVGGLFYGLLSGYCLLPVIFSPLFYYIALTAASYSHYDPPVLTMSNRYGLLMVIWFAAVAASTVRIGIDVFYYMRVAFFDEMLEQDRSQRIKETIEKKKHLENELTRLKQYEKLGLYAGGLAHDFNNMLTIIAGQMMSLRRTATDDFERKHIESIMGEVKKTSGLIKKLLLFTGKLDNKRDVFLLNSMQESIVDLVRHNCGTNNDVSATITSKRIMVHGDPSLFEISMIAFLLYIQKLSKQYSLLNISLTSPEEYRTQASGYFKTESVMVQQYALISFDAHIPQAPDWNHEELFIELLSVINSMGGTIKVSASQERVYFTIDIPSSTIQPDASAHYVLVTTGNGDTILLVDDDKVVLESTREVLQNSGYNVAAFFDPDAAIGAFRKSPKQYGIVLLDMRMPQKSGREVFNELLIIDPSVKVIIVSGYCSDFEVQDMVHRGAVDIIEKPYTEKELLTKVERFFKYH